MVAILSVLGISLFPYAQAWAQTLSSGQEIVVQAQILPARYIIIDKQNNIIEIGSNTKEDVLPQVYLGSIGSNSGVPLTRDIYNQYRGILPAGKSHAGVLYAREAGQPVKDVRHIKLLNLSSI